ncbi:MAG: tetratricopeptide repeat protein [Bacteroidales bacterium]
MKKTVWITLLMIGFLSTSAAEIDTLFFKANAAYANEYYEDAIHYYNKIIDAGFESPTLYFNLGNAYFKSQDMPSAILYYEKALKFSPNDEDIRFNLQTANTRIVDKIETVPELFIYAWWRSFYNMMPVDNWAILSVTGFIIFIVLFLFYLLSRYILIRKLAFFTGLFVLLMTIVSFSFAARKYYNFHHHKTAIVFTPTITVKSSPNPNSVDLFVIHEGSKVVIRDMVGEWYEIRIANGSVGWLPASSLRKI